MIFLHTELNTPFPGFLTPLQQTIFENMLQKEKLLKTSTVFSKYTFSYSDFLCSCLDYFKVICCRCGKGIPLLMCANCPLQIFQGLIQLRKLCNHPDLVTGGPRVFKNDKTNNNPELEYGFWRRSGKMIVVEALLKLWKKQGHKALFFTQSKQVG